MEYLFKITAGITQTFGSGRLTQAPLVELIAKREHIGIEQHHISSIKTVMTPIQLHF